MTLPFAAEIATPLLLIALVISAALLMLQLAVGPFGHMKFLHLHQSYIKQPKALRYPLTTIAITIIVLAVSHLLGIWGFQR